MDGVLPSPPPPMCLTCPSASAAATASSTSSLSSCTPESPLPHSSAARKTTPLTRRTASLWHLSSELSDLTTMTMMTATLTAFTRWIDQGHLHRSLIQGLNLWRSGMRDSKVSSTTEDSPTSSPRPFRPPMPSSTQRSTMLTSNSSQQQQQTKKKKKKKRKKKPQPSDLQPAKLPPAKVPSPMVTSSPMYAPDLPSSTSACTLTGYVHRVLLTRWTSLL